MKSKNSGYSRFRFDFLSISRDEEIQLISPVVIDKQKSSRLRSGAVFRRESLSPAIEYKDLCIQTEKGILEYSGSVLIQTETPHKDGRLTYPNGVCYEGAFENGRRSGFGKLVYDSEDGSKSWVIIGQWINGLPNTDIKWRIAYENNYEYCGYIELNPNKTESDALELEDFRKTREGELYCKPNDRYFGSFENDKKNGFGVQIFSNRDKYFGGWKDNQFHGEGTLIFSDGTIFRGTFSNNIRKGKGTIYWPNGDSMSGDWNDSKVTNAVFSKGTCSNCSPFVLNRIENEVKTALKNQLNAGYMSKCYGSIENNASNQFSYILNWKQYRIAHDAIVKKQRELLMQDFSKRLYNIEGLRECLTTLLEGKKEMTESQMYFKPLIDFFITIFYGTYYSNMERSKKKTHDLTMTYAIEDMKSFIMFLQDEVWEFINFIFEEMIAATKKIQPKFSKDRASKSFNFLITPSLPEDELLSLREKSREFCVSFISDFVHSKTYDAFFKLYETTYKGKDLLINQRLDGIQNCTPQQVGVKPIFLPANDKEQPYCASIKLLNDLLQQKSVSQKIQLLSDLKRLLHSEMRSYRAANRRIEKEKSGVYTEKDALEDSNWEAGADDDTPVRVYVFIKSQIRNHHAQFKYIDDWKDYSLETNPVLHLITFYEGFLIYMEDLDFSLQDCDGKLISIDSISRELEKAIIKETCALNLSECSSTVYNWIPLILVFLSMEVGTRSEAEIKRILIPADSNTKLRNILLNNYELVSRILSNCQSLGFSVSIEKDSLYIDMNNILPSHVYKGVSFRIGQWIQAELSGI